MSDLEVEVPSTVVRPSVTRKRSPSRDGDIDKDSEARYRRRRSPSRSRTSLRRNRSKSPEYLKRSNRRRYSSSNSWSRSPSYSSSPPRSRSRGREARGRVVERSPSYSRSPSQSRSRSRSLSDVLSDTRSPRRRHTFDQRQVPISHSSVSRSSSRSVSPAPRESSAPNDSLIKNMRGRKQLESSEAQKKRSRESDSVSPPARKRTSSPPHHRPLPDIDARRARERERQAAEREEKEVKPFDPQAEYERLLKLRSGGTYVPPARLRALQSQLVEKDSKEYQRIAWDNLKKAINGLVNKVNKSNIREIAQDVFKQNLVRGRGLFVRSVMRAQAASLPFTPVYAALVAIVNTKLPQIGELLLTRLIIQFRKAFRRNDKAVCISSTTFLAHLCNYQVAHEIVILQMLHLLLERPTDDSVEIAVGFMREVGAFLAETSAPANNGVFERFRAILHEGQLEKRTQYMIEVLFLIRKNSYEKNPIIAEDLDLIEEEDQITHMIGLDDELHGDDQLNVFKFDSEYEENEQKYKAIRDEILGSENDDSDGSDASSEEEDDEEEDESSEQKKLEIQDMTNKNLVNLRRTIYLTIRSSMDYEECCHKLMRINLQPGQEIELVNMIIECCSQEKIYSKFYGLIGERFCKINRKWQDQFAKAFTSYYDTIHRYETNRLRNIGKFFAHLLASDGLNWSVLECVHLNEEETTASSRIFLKILFQDIAEEMGMKLMLARFRNPDLSTEFEGIFNKKNPTDLRFSINFFTAIGLGAVTEDLRKEL
ncbi:pre-mRNA-splicing factor cwc22 [Dipodascopsis uninucleata]